ncbi:MAG TPA: YbhB/YbcL family Raf kinase inhibitor-like protein [Puia sp.]|jgi:hypothetical protein|nr:YbhB/YbcL family Raf kinase inhibitor-like protein [Puia sp.]
MLLTVHLHRTGAILPTEPGVGFSFMMDPSSQAYWDLNETPGNIVWLTDTTKGTGTEQGVFGYRLCITTSKAIFMLTIIGLIVYATLTVASPSFGANAMIPAKFTCEGAGVSPALRLGEFPAKTQSLAIIVHDPDAAKPGGFTHWVAWNIDPMSNIPEGFKGGVQGANGSGRSGYYGPCPPSGTHHYHFMVYALDTRLELAATAGKAELEKAMQGHILAQGDLVGLYKKSK